MDRRFHRVGRLGPIGALIGYFFGSFVDSQIDSFHQIGDSSGNTGSYTRSSSRTYSAGEQRNSFMVSLLVFSSAVIKADWTTYATSSARTSASPLSTRR